MSQDKDLGANLVRGKREKIVAENHSAEERLRESEEQYRRIVDTIREGMWVLGPDALTTQADARTAALLGYASDEFIGLPVTDFMFPEDVPDFLKRVERRQRGQAEDYELRLRRKDGRPVWVHVSATPIIDKLGSFEGSFAMLTDITDLKQIEHDLSLGEKQYRTLVENLPDLIVRYDTALRRTYVNPAWEAASGLSAGEVVNVAAEAIPRVPRPVAGEYLAVLRQALSTGTQQEMEFSWVNARGKKLYLQYIVVPEFDHEGKVVSLLAVGHDITEHKQVGTALAMREREFRSLAENLPDNIVRYDRDARTVYVNPALERTFGDAAEKMLGTTIREYQGNGEFEEYAQAVDAVLADGSNVEFEMKVPPLAGEPGKVHQIRVIAERDAHGEVIGVLAIGRDITERKHAERELILLNKAINESSDAVYLVDDQLRIIHVNDQACRSLGYSREELYRMTVADIDASLTFEQLREDWEKIDKEFTSSRRDTFETQHRTRDGRLFPVEVVVSLFEMDGVKYSLNIVRDITERKRAERELELLNTAVNASSESVFLINEAGRFVYVNDTACKSLGYSRDELLTFTSLDIDPDVTPEILAKLLQEVFASGPTLDVMETRHRTRDGRIFPVEMTGSVVEYDGTKLCLAVARDITERKNSEEQIRKLSQAVEQSPSSIVITDLQPNIIYVNQSFTANTGYPADEVIGKNPRLLQSGKTSRQVYDDLWAHLVKGETWRGEFINRRKDGSDYFESVMISPVRDANGQITNYLAIKEDITEKKRAAEREAYLAYFDQLTGLPNRVLLQDHFHHALKMAARSEENLAVLFLDLDHFKDINDTLGHSVGDQLLIEVSKRLKSALREADTVSRMGGDEFIFILPRTDENGAAHMADKLIEVVAAPCQIEQHQLIVTPSIGIAIYPEDGVNMELLSQRADAAMYQAKLSGRNGYRFFTQSMQIHSARNLLLGNELRQAIARNQLQLNYQPQIAVQDGHLVGAEALLRWHHPELGTISPAEFIPIAEDTGLIIPIGEWVLRTAIRQMKAWLDKGFPKMVMAVNLSAVQFRHARLPVMVSAMLAEEGLSPDHLELELTEAVAMDDPLGAIAVMEDFYERGIRMSIDDFGTGYSSLSYLKRFKVYKLKIDQTFVRDITDDPEDKAIVVAIINLASGLGIHTIAEGVETAAQLAFLRLQGCDEVQGYYFSKPLTADDFETFVQQMS